MTKKEREDKRHIWQERIDEYRKSGKSQKEWCKEHNVAISTMGYWIARLKNESCQEQLPQWLKCEIDGYGDTGILSVPATVVDSTGTGIAGEISINCGDITVHLPMNADDGIIGRIISILKTS